MKPSATLLKAYEAARTAIENEITVRAVIVPTQTRILKEMKAMVSSEYEDMPKREITKASETWMMSDEDFEIYMDLMTEEYSKLGYHLERGYCPLLMAESETRKAKQAFIDASQEINPVMNVADLDYDMKVKEEFFLLTYKYVGQFSTGNYKKLAGKILK